MSKIKIISWNINGIRTRSKNNEIDPIFNEDPDIILFQETKVKYEQLDSKLKDIENYYSYYSPGKTTRSGGIASFSKIKPQIVKKFFENPDKTLNNRVQNFDFNDFTLLHIYGPTGSGAKANLEDKLNFYNKLIDYAKKISNKKVIIAGSFNIAHTDKDIANPEDKSNSVTYLNVERKILDKLEELGYVDAYRSLNPEKTSYSSWKSQKAKDNNEGSRLDYFFLSEGIKNSINKSSILNNIKGSKHSPIELIIDI
jgi:exodeoxyribonuclease-3